MEDKFLLRKKKSIFGRIYYDLLKNKQCIGNAYIIKKTSSFRNGLYIKLIPEERNKGYSSKFYELLINKLAKLEVEFIFIKVNRKDKKVQDFFDKVTDKYTNKLKVFGNIIYQVDLIIE